MNEIFKHFIEVRKNYRKFRIGNICRRADDPNSDIEITTRANQTEAELYKMLK